MDENLLDGYIFSFFLDQKNEIDIIEINNYFLVKLQRNTECGLLKKQFYFVHSKKKLFHNIKVLLKRKSAEIKSEK